MVMATLVAHYVEWFKKENKMSARAVEQTHPFDEATDKGRPPYKVADLNLARQGRDEIRVPGPPTAGAS